MLSFPPSVWMESRETEGERKINLVTPCLTKLGGHSSLAEPLKVLGAERIGNAGSNVEDAWNQALLQRPLGPLLAEAGLRLWDDFQLQNTLGTPSSSVC